MTNADHQTVPAYLEKALNDSYANTSFNVKNLGVVGYTSIQELLNIRFNLLSELPKPDMLILMNGVNDYHNTYLSESEKFDDLLLTALGTKKTFNFYWDFHNERKILNYQSIFFYLNYIFSNTVNLIKKANKFFAIKNANKDIQIFIDKYLHNKSKAYQLAEKNLIINNQFYLSNMRMIAEMAKNDGIKVLFILQPTLYEAEKIKNLVGEEISEYIHTKTGYFALKDEKVKKLKKVKSELIQNKYYWDFDQYLYNYKKLRGNLKELCSDLNVDYLSMDAAIKRNKNRLIFSSPWHYTYIGAQIFGNEIKDKFINGEYFLETQN